MVPSTFEYMYIVYAYSFYEGNFQGDIYFHAKFFANFFTKLK